jgi:hypothetical protein
MDIRNTKISVGTIFTAISVGGIVMYGWSLRNMAKKAQIQVGARVHKIDWNGVSIVIEGRIINPTSGTVRVRQPLISLYGSESARKNNMPFSVSQNTNATFTIPPQETKELESIMLHIPMGAILQMIAQGYLNGGELNLVIQVQTELYARYVPFSIPVSMDLRQKITNLQPNMKEALPNEKLTEMVVFKPMQYS